MPNSASTPPALRKKWSPWKPAPSLRSPSSSARRIAATRSAWLSDLDVIVTDKELRRALVGAADHRQQARYLAPRDQPQRAAFRAGEHRPIGVVVVADVARIFQHEHCPRLHLLRDPLRQYIQFLDHDTSLVTSPATC